MRLYILARAILRLYFRFFYKWKIFGKEHVPKTGPVILASNHISNLDPPVLGCSIDRQVHYMAKEELFHIPILSFLIKNFGAFPIRRGASDRKAIKTALHLLQEGKVLGVFPEGTRSKTGEIGKGLPGAALFALKTDAVVIPVGIVSNYKWFQPISIQFGEPVSLEAFKEEKVTQEVLNDAIATIMEQIKKQVDDLKRK